MVESKYATSFVVGIGIGIFADSIARLLFKKPVFADNFDSYIQGSSGVPIWHTISGLWEVHNGEMVNVQTPTDPNVASVIGTPVAQNTKCYQYSWDMSGDPIAGEGEYFRIGFGFFGIESSRGFFLDQSNTTLTLRWGDNETEENPFRWGVVQQWTDLSNSSTKHSYRVKYDASTTSFEIYKDGALITKTAYPAIKAEFAGYIGLAAMNAAFFDNIKVEESRISN